MEFLDINVTKDPSLFPMLFTIHSTGGFYRKPYSSLVLKIVSNKSAKQKNSTLLMNIIFRTENDGRKPDKI
jgi:hypothetical protein